MKNICLILSIILNIVMTIMVVLLYNQDLYLLYCISLIILPLALYFSTINYKTVINKINISFSIVLFFIMFLINSKDMLSWYIKL